MRVHHLVQKHERLNTAVEGALVRNAEETVNVPADELIVGLRKGEGTVDAGQDGGQEASLVLASAHVFLGEGARNGEKRKGVRAARKKNGPLCRSATDLKEAEVGIQQLVGHFEIRHFSQLNLVEEAHSIVFRPVLDVRPKNQLFRLRGMREVSQLDMWMCDKASKHALAMQGYGALLWRPSSSWLSPPSRPPFSFEGGS